MEFQAKLPSLEHLHYTDYDYVYEPSDDTFLLCDALSNEYQEELSKHFTYCEIGSGSGCVITFIGQLLKSNNYINPLLLAVDVNNKANEMTLKTATANDVHVECVRMNLISSFRDSNSIDKSNNGSYSYNNDLTSSMSLSTLSLLPLLDVIIFNPPYVPTPTDEVGGEGIEASWAGGENGRQIIDEFLLNSFSNNNSDNNITCESSSSGSSKLCKVLSPEGVIYMILVEENKPQEVIQLCDRLGLVGTIILSRRARNELLHVLKIKRKK